jgi:hypothetical protein
MARWRPVQLSRWLLVLAALGLTGCFEYTERLVFDRQGAVDAKISYLLPDWLPGPEMGAAHEARRDPIPRDAAALKRHFGAHIVIDGAAGDSPAGFSGRFKDVRDLDTPFIRHRMTFEKGGHYTYRMRISMPAGYSAAVSAEIERRAARLPFVSAPRALRVRNASLDTLGFRFHVDLPGPILEAPGQLSASSVAWHVPLRAFLQADSVEFEARGRLTRWQRLLRSLGR